MDTPSSAVLTGRAARMVRRTITFAVLAIAGLTFSSSFGNGLMLGVLLGVPRWIAVCVSPAVDLSALALIISTQYVRSASTTARLVGARALLLFSGLVTITLNVAVAVYERHFGRAAYDSVPPLLLIGWSEVGPGLLVLLHGSVPTTPDDSRDEQDGTEVVPDELGPSPELVARARQLDHEHRQATGRPISRDRLRPALGISNALASELVRMVRAKPPGGEDT